MKKLLKRFTSSENKNNLVLIPLPTGVGKTFQTAEFITEQVEDNKDKSTYLVAETISDYIDNGGKRKIYYITPLKKNATSMARDLKDMLEKRGIDYGSNVIFVDSISGYIIENYHRICEENPRIKELIRSFTKNSERFDNLDSSLEYYHDLKTSKKNGIKIPNEVVEKAKKEIRQAEKLFRNMIHAVLPKDDPKNLFALLLNDERYSWIPMLYPSVYMFDSQVCIMTVNKFIDVQDTIIEGSYKLYESSKLNEAIIFIDEFDASKDAILKKIVEDQNKIDYLAMFRTIYYTLSDRDNLFIEFYQESDKLLKNKGAGYLKRMVDGLYCSADRLCREFHLEYLFKAQEKTKGNYIFHDYRSITVGKSGQFSIKADSDRKINDIFFAPNRGRLDYTVNSLFSQLYTFFRKFDGVIRSLARNQADIMKQNGEYMPQDAALCTVLAPYGFNDEQLDSILGTIRLMAPTKLTDKSRKDDMSVYRTGIAYYEFEDDISHNLNTRIFSTAYNLTPEKILLKVLEKEGVKVIGISATAALNTVVGNYDLSYLKHRSECKMEVIQEEEWERLEEMCRKAFAGYDKVNIIPKILSGDEESWYDEDPNVSAVFHNSATYSRIKLLFVSLSQFAKTRYLKLAKAYKEFLLHDDLKSFLAFFNRTVRARNNEPNPENRFCEEDIDELFKAIREEVGIHGDNLGYGILKGMDSDDEFKKQLDGYRTRLSMGEKLFILTTYPTVGAGQNLQYSCPNTEGLVRINNFKEKPERSDDLTSYIPKKDFDAIYLEEPMNIIPRVVVGDKPSLARALFIIEFLLESREISFEDAQKRIRDSFLAFHKELPYSGKTKDKASMKMAYAKLIIQAIGRICRTNLKNRNIYILADENLCETFCGDINEYGRLRNPEFEQLFKALRAYDGRIGSSVTPSSDGTDLASSRAYANIQKYLKSKNWDENLIDAWNNLRQNVLKHPTCEELGNGMFYYSYYCLLNVPSDQLRYREMYDYEKVIIDRSGNREVSSKAARLEELLKLPAVRNWFEERGYATYWQPNTRIMSPVLFHNIYLGALGEEVGQAIFADWKVPLTTLPPEIYELFDFRIDGKTYVDFKHHAGRMNIDYDEEIEHICDKLDLINEKMEETIADTVYIVNILQTETGLKEVNTTDHRGYRIVEIPYLYDRFGGRNKAAYNLLVPPQEDTE